MIVLLPDLDPFENLPYSCDFTNFLDADDGIFSANVRATPGDLVVTTPIITEKIITSFVSNGTLGASYELSFEVISTNGWSVKRSGTINIINR